MKDFLGSDVLVILLGALVGWALSERSSVRREHKEDREAKRSADRARVLHLVVTTQRASRLGISLVDGTNRRLAGGTIDPDQFRQAVDTWNELRDSVDTTLTEVLLEGPDWLREHTEALDDALNVLVHLVAQSANQHVPDSDCAEAQRAILAVCSEIIASVPKA